LPPKLRFISIAELLLKQSFTLVLAKTRKVFVFQLIAIQISAVVMLKNDIAVTVPTHYFGKLHVNQNSGPNCITQQI
jgi:hypothetical protein